MYDSWRKQGTIIRVPRKHPFLPDCYPDLLQGRQNKNLQQPKNKLIMGPRQFTDKTVHRHVIWRQFIDEIGDSSPTYLKTVKMFVKLKMKKNGIMCSHILVKRKIFILIFHILPSTFNSVFCVYLYIQTP